MDISVSSTNSRPTWTSLSSVCTLPLVSSDYLMPFPTHQSLSGAEGILISEQSSLPRMIWGLDGHAVNSGSWAFARSPQTPNVHLDLDLQSSERGTVDSTNSPYPAHSAFPTPASTVVATPSSIFDMPSESPNKVSPGLVKPIEPTRLSDNGEEIFPHTSPGRHARRKSDSVQVKGLGSPLQLGTPGGYVEHHYDESPEWEEFIPSSASDDVLKSLATASPPLTDMLSQNPSQQVVDICASRPPSIATMAPIQNDYSGTGLPAVTEMTDNPAAIATATPEMWSLALRKFWTDTFLQLGMQQRSLLAQAALAHGGVLAPSFSIPPGTSLSSITPLLPSQSAPSEKQVPYTGAIDNPRSVPMQRLRRKLATVKEEKENESDAARKDPKLQAETRSVLQPTQEGPRVRIPQRSNPVPSRSAPPSSGNAAVSSSKHSTDVKKRRGGNERSIDLSSSAGSNGSGRANSSRYTKGPTLVQRVKESNSSSSVASSATKTRDGATRDGIRRKTRFGPSLITTS